MTAAPQEIAPEVGRTPGPWECRRSKHPVDGAYDWAIGAVIEDGGPYCIAEVCGRVGEDVYAPAEASAAFIVRACNSHDDLLAALVKARDVINACYVTMGVGEEGRTANLATFDAAIAKARAS